MTTFRNQARDGMTLNIADALKLQDDKGNPINLQLVKDYDAMSGKLPSYYSEDYETGKIYSLNILPPNDLMTLHVSDMTPEQQLQQMQQQKEQQLTKKKSK